VIALGQVVHTSISSAATSSIGGTSIVLGSVADQNLGPVAHSDVPANGPIANAPCVCEADDEPLRTPPPEMGSDFVQPVRCRRVLVVLCRVRGECNLEDLRRSVSPLRPNDKALPELPLPDCLMEEGDRENPARDDPEAVEFDLRVKETVQLSRYAEPAHSGPQAAESGHEKWDVQPVRPTVAYRQVFGVIRVHYHPRPRACWADLLHVNLLRRDLVGVGHDLTIPVGRVLAEQMVERLIRL